MEWTATKMDKPLPRIKMEMGPLHISIATQEDGRQWQYIALSLGEFSAESLESCQQTWPARAIERVHELLEQLEAEAGITADVK